MYKAMKKNEGFTLVELMIVVLIIGILVAIAVPIFNNATKKSKENSCRANIRTIQGAVTQYEANHDGSIPADVDALVTDKELKSNPVCPIDSTKLYTIDQTSGNVIHDDGTVIAN